MQQYKLIISYKKVKPDADFYENNKKEIGRRWFSVRHLVSRLTSSTILRSRDIIFYSLKSSFAVSVKRHNGSIVECPDGFEIWEIGIKDFIKSEYDEMRDFLSGYAQDSIDKTEHSLKDKIKGKIVEKGMEFFYKLGIYINLKMQKVSHNGME